MGVWQETLSAWLFMIYVAIGAILLDYCRGPFLDGATCKRNVF